MAVIGFWTVYKRQSTLQLDFGLSTRDRKTPIWILDCLHQTVQTPIRTPSLGYPYLIERDVRAPRWEPAKPAGCVAGDPFAAPDSAHY